MKRSLAPARIVAILAMLLMRSSASAGQAPPSAGTPQAGDHSQHSAGQAPASQAAPPNDHSAHQTTSTPEPLPDGLPPVTDEDRAAAFPTLNGQHTVHDDGINSFVLFDQLEWQGGDGATVLNWDTNGWVGRDVNRFWFRTEGEGDDDRLENAQAHALYGRAIHPWWDIVAGLRQDLGPGPDRTWAAFGIQGLAPYWFEVEATGYLGAGGRTHFRLEAEYELLLTNRLVLQPLTELEIYGKSDPELDIGAGLSSLDVGLRVRYEIRREFAPYVGVTWNRRFFGTADRAAAAGEDISTTRLALGLRLWF